MRWEPQAGGEGEGRRGPGDGERKRQRAGALCPPSAPVRGFLVEEASGIPGRPPGRPRRAGPSQALDPPGRLPGPSPRTLALPRQPSPGAAGKPSAPLAAGTQGEGSGVSDSLQSDSTCGGRGALKRVTLFIFAEIPPPRSQGHGGGAHFWSWAGASGWPSVLPCCPLSCRARASSVRRLSFADASWSRLGLSRGRTRPALNYSRAQSSLSWPRTEVRVLARWQESEAVRFQPSVLYRILESELGRTQKSRFGSLRCCPEAS